MNRFRKLTLLCFFAFSNPRRPSEAFVDHGIVLGAYLCEDEQPVHHMKRGPPLFDRQVQHTAEHNWEIITSVFLKDSKGVPPSILYMYVYIYILICISIYFMFVFLLNCWQSSFLQ